MNITPALLLAVAVAYFGVLYLISRYTSEQGENADFFIGNKESNWMMVAFGMIGTTLSGATFISLPGVVGAGGYNQGFAYMQMVMGFLLGYFVIATVLMPIYYRYNLTTIYGYLEQRLGFYSYKTGSAFFLISRVIGASFRLFLVAIVLQEFVLGAMGVPFWANVLLTLLAIFLYSQKGGIKTIVVTDTVQTTAMITAVVLTIYFIGQNMELSVGEMFQTIKNSDYSQVFFFEGGWNDPNNFFKQFISGALMAIVMTGLDQDMMQKNLSCRNLEDAQKNMFTFSIVLAFAKMLFLALGALLWIHASQIGIEIPERTDLLYPTIAFEHLPVAAGIIFFIGLIAAAYSSADSALTALTTAFCIDFLDFEKKEQDPAESKKTRKKVHLAITAIVFLTVMLFWFINDDAVINNLFKVAGYTYGPLLGLFLFAIGTKSYGVRDNLVPVVCIAAPILAWVIDANSAELLNGFSFGFLIVALNGLLTFLGLWLISYKKSSEEIL